MSDSAPLAMCHTGPVAPRSRTAARILFFSSSFSPLLPFFFSLHPPSFSFLLVFINLFSSSSPHLFPFFLSFFFLLFFILPHLHPFASPSSSDRIGTHTECLHTYSIQHQASDFKHPLASNSSPCLSPVSFWIRPIDPYSISVRLDDYSIQFDFDLFPYIVLYNPLFSFFGPRSYRLAWDCRASLRVISHQFLISVKALNC